MTRQWPPHIERWRQYAQWECKDIPVDLVLAIIAHESGGRAGTEAERPCKPDTLPTDGGGQIVVNHAMGLMQVIPSNVTAWNQNKKPVITYQDMTGKDERAVRLQIRIGCSIFASYVHKLHQFDPVVFPGTSPGTAHENQLSLALVAYAIGPGKPGGKRGLIPKLEQLKANNKPMNLTALSKAFPKWGYSEQSQRWTNRPVQYGHSVWAKYNKVDKHAATIKTSFDAAALFPLALIAGAFVLKNYRGVLGNLRF